MARSNVARPKLAGSAVQKDGMTTGRLEAFSDGVIAVIITIMVLELKAPDNPAFSALLPLWPTAISYAVSYLFVAIIWVNHHHLLRFVQRATPGLIWVNFAHLFAVSLLPFTTAWIARTRLASAPMMAYGAVFVCVNVAFVVFEGKVLAQATIAQISEQSRRRARYRSLATLTIFAAAILVSVIAPFVAFGLICMALILYLRPEAPHAWL